jgi:2-methylcitrate dehydratase PrpD
VAVAQAIGASGRQLLTASVAGYEVGIRVGEFLGRSHYKVFHTTGTAGTLAAAAAVGNGCSAGRRADAARLRLGRHAVGGAVGVPAHGRRQQAAAHRARRRRRPDVGLSGQGRLHRRAEIFEGAQGMAAGMSSDADPLKLTAGLGRRWATAETSFKYHASCRHTHPAADALLHVMRTHDLQHGDLARVVTHVHQGAIDVLGPVVKPATVHQSKFSMGTVLGLVARYGRAGLTEFAQHFEDEVTRALRDRVEMKLDMRWTPPTRALDRQGHGAHRRRPRTARPGGRTQGRPRQHAQP